MENPFNEISERLERIENLLTDRHEMRLEPSEDEDDKLLIFQGCFLEIMAIIPASLTLLSNGAMLAQFK